MRTHLFRPLLAVVLLALMAAPALAQRGLVRGKVVDEKGQPVADATVTFEAVNSPTRREAKTDGKGEFQLVGVTAGDYRILAIKKGVGEDLINFSIQENQNQPLSFTLRAGTAKPAAASALGAAAPTDAKAAAALQALAKQGVEYLNTGKDDEAIAAFSEVIAKAPSCTECYYNLGVGHLRKKQYPEAEAALKKAIELKADHADAYRQLVSVYNAQKKFDLASEANAKATSLAGAAGVAGAAGAAGGGGGSAEALYNQGVILFNAGKYADAKAEFERATKADPKMALAHYQLGMTALNLGDFALAVSSLETYLQLDPNGAKAAEVKASLPTLKGMVKK